MSAATLPRTDGGSSFLELRQACRLAAALPSPGAPEPARAGRSSSYANPWLRAIRVPKDTGRRQTTHATNPWHPP
eukprot:4648372-Prymnesium_polylepis.2